MLAPVVRLALKLDLAMKLPPVADSGEAFTASLVVSPKIAR